MVLLRSILLSSKMLSIYLQQEFQSLRQGLYKRRHITWYAERFGVVFYILSGGLQCGADTRSQVEG